MGNATDDRSDDGNDILTQLKSEGNRSSTNSTSSLSDSINASDFEYGNNSRTDMKTLDESLSNFDALLLSRGNAGPTQRLNSSFGSLNKTRSVRQLDNNGLKSSYPRRRSSVHGYTSTDTYEIGSPTFYNEFKASVDDWNSELPLDSDDENNTSLYSQLNASITASVKSPSKHSKDRLKVSTTTGSSEELSESKSPSKERKMKKTKSKGRDVAGEGNVGEHDAAAVAPPSSSRTLLPSKKSSWKVTSGNWNGSGDEVAPVAIATTANAGKKKGKTTTTTSSSSSLSKMVGSSAMFRTLRGGMSFRSTDSTKSTGSHNNNNNNSNSNNAGMSKSEHFPKPTINCNHNNTSSKAVLVEGTCTEYE